VIVLGVVINLEKFSRLTIFYVTHLNFELKEVVLKKYLILLSFGYQLIFIYFF